MRPRRSSANTAGFRGFDASDPPAQARVVGSRRKRRARNHASFWTPRETSTESPGHRADIPKSVRTQSSEGARAARQHRGYGSRSMWVATIASAPGGVSRGGGGKPGGGGKLQVIAARSTQL